MVVLATKHPSRLAQGQASGDLTLRVVGTARNGQIVRLLAPKCTIGSAPGCTLRLVAAGVRPLHCVILRGSRGTVVRSWTAGTRLNGQVISDTLLVVGDRLLVGPIELEVLASETPEPKSREHASQSEAASPRPIAIGPPAQGLNPREELAAPALQTSAELARLESAREAFQQQRQQWEEETACTRRDLEEKQESDRRAREAFRLVQGSLEQQRDAWAIENARIETQLDRERTELLQQREETARWFKEMEHNRAQLQTQFESKLTQLEQEQQDWKTHQRNEEGRLAEAWAELDVQREALRGSHDEIELSRQMARQEREQAAAELAATRQHSDQQRDESQDHLTQQTTLHQQRQTELERRGAELDAATRELRQRETSAAQAEASALATAAELDERRTKLEAQEAVAALGDVDRAASVEREQQLEAHRNELEAQRILFERECQTWRESQSQNDAHSAEHLEQLKRQTAELRQQEATLQAERQDVARARHEQENQLAEKVQALEQMLAQVEDRRAALDAESRAHQDEQQHAAEGLRNRSAELENRESEIAKKLETTTWAKQETLEFERRRATFEAEQAAFVSERSVWQEQNQSPLFLQAEPELDDIQPTSEDESPTTGLNRNAAAEYEPETAEILAEPTAKPARPRSDDTSKPAHEEQSIEEYMAGLLNRMRGGSSSEVVITSTPKLPRNSDPPPPVAPSPIEPGGRDVSSGQNVDMPLTSGEMVRRPQFVETSDLVAMRELANTHARNAIGTHGKKGVLRTAIGSFGAGIAFLAGALGIFYWWPAGDLAMQTGGMVLVVASVYWTFLGAKSVGQLRMRQR